MCLRDKLDCVLFLQLFNRLSDTEVFLEYIISSSEVSFFGLVGGLLAAPPERGELRGELKRLSAKKWRHPINGEWVSFGASTIGSRVRIEGQSVYFNVRLATTAVWCGRAFPHGPL